MTTLITGVRRDKFCRMQVEYETAVLDLNHLRELRVDSRGTVLRFGFESLCSLDKFAE